MEDLGIKKEQILYKIPERHGMSKTPIYQKWRDMRKRCYHPNNIQYENYGGRGIEVCEEWKVSFLQFYSDMGDPPTSNHQLDRIDNDGNYEPSNCKWATPSENSSNKRDSPNKTGFPNVKKTIYGTYTSRFQYQNNTYFPGTFPTAEEAYEACQRLKEKVKDNLTN